MITDKRKVKIKGYKCTEHTKETKQDTGANNKLPW